MSYRILLIPHAGRKYSQEAVNKATRFIKPGQYERLLVISTDHGLGEKEHSWVWSKGALRRTRKFSMNMLNKAEVHYVKNEKESVEKTVDILKETLLNESKTLIICNTDLVHYGEIYNNKRDISIDEARKWKEQWERPLLNNLKKGVNVVETISGMILEKEGIVYDYRPCGMSVLVVLSYIIEKFNYGGTQFSYYDSFDIDKKGDNFVSYVSMGFRPKSIGSYNIDDFAENFVERWSDIVDKNENNPIFLGLKDIDTGKTCASMGDLSDSPIEDKIINVYQDLLQDLNSGRLGCNKHISPTNVFLYVNILESPVKEDSPWSLGWWTIERKDYEESNIENHPRKVWGKYYGMQVVWNSSTVEKPPWVSQQNFIPGNRTISSIFIPAVWKEHPTWTGKRMLEELSKKAGLPKDAWKESDHVNIFLDVGTFT